MAIAADSRGFVGAKNIVKLGGKVCGGAYRATGGSIHADVMSVSLAADPVVRKHLGSFFYEPVTIMVGLDLEPELYACITETWSGQHVRKDLTVIKADFNMNAISERTFHQSLLTEVTIPELDAHSKDLGRLALTFTPETMVMASKSGKVGVEPPTKKPSTFLLSNFRLTIDGLDCKRVSRIDPLTVTQKVTIQGAGAARDFHMEPGSLDVPMLKFYLPAGHAQPFKDYFKHFVLEGHDGDSDEKSGKLELISPNLTTVLATITFGNLGIYRIAEEEMPHGYEGVEQFSVEMYCETMTFAMGAGAGKT